MSTAYAAIPSEVARSRTIGDSAKVVFLALSTYADRDGRCWPSQTRLAEDTGKSVATVRRALDTLREAGLLTWEVKVTTRGRQRLYRVWRPGQTWQGSAQPGRGVGSSETHGVGSSETHEVEPGEPEPVDLPGGAAAAGEQTPLDGMPVAEPRPRTEVPNAGTLVKAWCDGYREAYGRPHDPSVTPQVAGNAGRVARSRTDVESWRIAWRAFHAAGADGSLYISRYLLDQPPPSRPVVPDPRAQWSAAALRDLPPPVTSPW